MGNGSTRQQLQMKAAQKKYQELSKKYVPAPRYTLNAFKAFMVGGLICTFGQFLQWMYAQYFGFTEKTASNPTVATLIFISILLTGLGVYDKIGQWAGAGTAVPVTGFANSISSAAIEHRSEGFVLGVGGNMFKLAGSVIVFGVVAAFLAALIKTIIQMIIGGGT